MAQAVIIICDVLIIILNYQRLILLRTMIYPFLYALKLEFEFVVLNRLIYITQQGQNQSPVVLSQDTCRTEKLDLENGSITEIHSSTPVSLSSPGSDGIELERNCTMDEMERRYLGRHEQLE